MSSPDRVTDLLAERGRERRALGRVIAKSHSYEGHVPHTASCAEPGDALQTNPPAVDSVCGRCDGSGVIQQGFHYMGPGFRTALQGDPCPEHGEYTGDHCAVFVTDEVNYEDIGACGYESRIGERDLAYALEEALLHDGDRRRAMAVLACGRTSKMPSLLHLSARQQEVVDKLREGWVLESSMTNDGGWNLRGPDRGWLTVNGNTAHALWSKKVIQRVGRRFPTATYGLTEAYRA